jgi:hypothetical protein
MDFEDPITQKKSIGALRKNQTTKPRSPDLIGELHFQRHAMEAIAKQFNESGSDEVICDLAAWGNHDKRGDQFLSVVLSPRIVARKSEPQRSNIFDFVFNHQQDEVHSED